MTGWHPFSELEAKMSPAARTRSNEKARKLRREMDLAQIRQAVKLTQEELAATMNIGQAAVAKIERRSDLYLSTVRRFIKAMGGELLLIARFPDREIEINTLRLPADEMQR
jgi:DNA-binding transcriptional regulator YiaG